MNRFDAINHAMTTVATGAFRLTMRHSATSSSIPLLWVSTFFMTLCSLPFSILIVLVVRGRLDALRDPQIIVFLGYLTAFSVAVAAYHRLANGVEFHLALTYAFFNITSILSTRAMRAKTTIFGDHSWSWSRSYAPSSAVVPARRRAHEGLQVRRSLHAIRSALTSSSTRMRFMRSAYGKNTGRRGCAAAILLFLHTISCSGFRQSGHGAWL